jgi:alkanesulfonate monooxygenase SsuD/methylene tetrahydromethanopterin reductase-like flavin-dependent oxidoreductase (luciferase family)
MCTAIACATERIAIGPAATIAPLRHPTLLAKEFTGVDRISNGRLILALGVGGDNPKEFEANGIPTERAGRRTTETLEIVRRYFSGERFSYRGEIFQLDDVWIDPSPARPGGPPLWVAGRRAPTLRRAALLGDGVLPYMITPQSFKGIVRSVRETASAAERVLPVDYAFAAYVYVAFGEDDAEARRRADEHLAWRYDEPRFLGDLSGKYAIGGNAAACVDRLGEFLAAGATHLVVSLIRGEAENPSEALGAFAAGVLPALRSAAVPGTGARHQTRL